MRRLLKIIPIITFFLLIIEVVPVKSNLISNSFYILEEEIKNKGEFIQNGFRVEYTSEISIEEEMRLVKNNLEKNNYKNIIEKDNNIFISDKYKDIQITFWSNEEGTKVQISYTNNNKNNKTIELKKEIEQIQNIAVKNIKYFNFIKVKIIEDSKQDILEILKSTINIGSLEEVYIDNGKVAKGNLKDGSNFNFAIVTYDTGEYLILGTPVIFITY